MLNQVDYCNLTVASGPRNGSQKFGVERKEEEKRAKKTW